MIILFNYNRLNLVNGRRFLFLNLHPPKHRLSRGESCVSKYETKVEEATQEKKVAWGIS